MNDYRKSQLIAKVKELRNLSQLIAESNRDGGAHQELYQDTLIQCQNMAIEIGNALEVKEQGKLMVPILEQFCENIYQLSLVQDRPDEIHRYCSMLREELDQLNSQITSDIIDKKEVVFFPYKVSMWDSLESVWRAACQEEDTDVYVVPIPYFDKKSDGSFGYMHYEGNEFPEYVTVTSFEEYNLEDRKPDIIFIHNPYDNTNRVTSVHPRYYSKNLKKYTDKLVYIPYFVSREDHIREDLCIALGILYADYVIVQSEAVKKMYIEHIRHFEQENHAEGIYGDLDKKILPLGSPKFDSQKAALNQPDLQILPDWIKIIQNSNNKRKIIFYNTTVGNAVLYREKMLDKIERMLEEFKEHRDQFVLLWRPHPLLEETFKYISVELVQRYRKIVDKYKEEQWGIFDDTPQMNTAITISDAYFGDSGSVLIVYKQTGKPIMIQNYNV